MLGARGAPIDLGQSLGLARTHPQKARTDLQPRVVCRWLPRSGPTGALARATPQPVALRGDGFPSPADVGSSTWRRGLGSARVCGATAACGQVGAILGS